MIGNNCAGIRNKKDSLLNMVKTLNVGMLFLQETKLYSKGQIKFQHFVMFETNRSQNGGGGLLTAVHEKFQPSLVETEKENPDILIVQCKISESYVSLIIGYGPQESDPMGEKIQFFSSFETAVQSGILRGDLICAELDANSKIGMENIQSAPNLISGNGQLLMDIVSRNDLIVVNSTAKCSGVITRIRKTKHSEEKSVIDYFIVCRRFFELICSLEIDESRKYVLTKYSSRMGVQCVVESDHNPLMCTLNITWDKRVKKERKEIFRLKDAEGLRVFNEITSNCPKLVELSLNSTDLQGDSNKWMKQIEDIMHKSFKKIRISDKEKPQNPELSSLMKAKHDLREKLSFVSSQENPDLLNKIKENIKIIESETSVICSEQNMKIIREHMSELSNEGDKVCRLNMWKLKQKLCPRNLDPPMAKKDASSLRPRKT